MGDGPNGTGVRVVRDDRVRRIAAVVQHLLSDLARVGYGERADFAYVAPACSIELGRALEAVTVEHGVVEADYGEQVQGTAYLPDTEGPVQVEIIVVEHSVLRAASGERSPLAPARWLLDLALDSGCSEILSLAVRPA